MLTPARWHELRCKSEYYKSLRGLILLPFISLTFSSPLASLLQAQSAHEWLNKSSSSNHLFLMNSSLSPDLSVLSHFALPCSFISIQERERYKIMKGRWKIVFMQWSHSRNTTLRLLFLFDFSNWQKWYWEKVCIINEEKREKHKYTDWKRRRTTVTAVVCCKMPASCVLSVFNDCLMTSQKSPQSQYRSLWFFIAVSSQPSLAAFLVHFCQKIIERNTDCKGIKSASILFL